MKKLFKIFLILSPLAFTGCKCKILENPDLIHEGITFAIKLISGEHNYETKDISTSFVNLAAKVAKRCECGKGTETAPASAARWNVYFDPNSGTPDNWGKPEDSTEVDKNALAACAQDITGIQSDFLVTGYYLLECILDYDDNVDERDENNNDKKKTLRRPESERNVFAENERYGNNRMYQVIYVEVKNGKPVFDAAGKQIFCRIRKTY